MPEEKKEVVYIDVDKILIPEERVTSIVDEDKLKELEESIKERGILQPLHIIQVDNKYILVDGLHRLFVAKKLGMKKVPCLVKKGTMRDVLVENLIVNRQRGISDPIGEATVLKTLMDEYKMSLAQAARELKISESTARKYLQILKLPEEVKQLLRQKKLSLGCAYWISKLEDKNLQIEVANDAVAYGYTEEMCRARVLQLMRPDISPEDTGYTFTPQGAPQKVLPRCSLCGKEIEEGGTYLWFHDECAQVILSAIEEMKRAEEEKEEEKQPPQPVQPQPMQQQYFLPTPMAPSVTPIPQPQPQSTITAQPQQGDWVWLDECTLVNRKTKQIVRIC